AGESEAGLADEGAAGRQVLKTEGVPLAEIMVVHEVDLLFRGQSHVFRVPVTAPGFYPRVVLGDFLERYKARFDIELPEMTAILVNLRTTVIGRRAPVDLATFAPAIGEARRPRPCGPPRGPRYRWWCDAPPRAAGSLAGGARPAPP